MTARIENTVFISYRRTNSFMARAVYQSLTAKGYDVFFDFEGINSGDFEQIILGNIRARAHFLVILTPSALERCKDENDWLRREIETALDEKRNIVPLLFEGFDFGNPAVSRYLIGKMAMLKKYQGINVHSDYFNEAMEKLCNRFLNIPLEAVLHPLSDVAQKATYAQQIAANESAPVGTIQLSAEEWFERGFVFLFGEKENPDEAIRCFSEAIRLKPDDSILYFVRGLSHGNNKENIDDAIKDFSESIRLKSRAGPFNLRGLLRYTKKDLDGAIADFTEAIRLSPGNAKAFYYRGAAYSNKDDHDSAIVDFDKAILLQPDDADVYYSRGLERNQKGDYDGAIADFDKAIRLKPANSEAYYGRAKAREHKGDLDGAVKDLTEAIHLKPEDPKLYTDRGVVHGMKGNHGRAIKDFTDAIRLKPDAFVAYLNRGIARSAKGDLDGAIKDYNEAIHLKPDYDYAYRNRGIAYSLKEDYYLAVAGYEKYFNLGGTEEKVRQYLNDAKKKISK